MSLTASVPLTKAPLSPEPLYRLLFGRPLTQLLYSAHDLGIFKALAGQPKTEAELGKELNLPERPRAMLLNTCAALGLLRKEGTSYANSPLADHYLVAGSDFYLGGMLEHFRRQVYPAWDHVREAIQEDGAQIGARAQAGKSDIFQITQQDDGETELFIAAMHALSVSDGLHLAEAFDFSRFRLLLDVGGGSGALSLAVASRYPEIRALVWDRPPVSTIAQRYIDRAGLSQQVQSVGGDAFGDPLPEGVDVVLLSLFIHAFGLKRARPLLEKCYRALPAGGCLLIYEPVLDETRQGPMTTLLSSLNMLVATPSGEDVSAADYQACLRDVGFEDIFYTPVPAIRHLIGGRKPT